MYFMYCINIYPDHRWPEQVHEDSGGSVGKMEDNVFSTYSNVSISGEETSHLMYEA